MTISRFHSLMIGSALLLQAGSSPLIAGEKLYNGIVLPDEWPPKIAQLTREPMAVPYLQNRPEVIPIDVGRQLFVDDFLIEDTTLHRTFHTAAYHPACPVIRPELPWESTGESNKPCAMVFSDGVWYDPQAKIFKAWYTGGYCKSVCYATSKDGIHWEKPSLDVIPGTNMVLKTSRDSSTVWYDPLDADAARRYKLLYAVQRRDGKNGCDLVLRYSADGIHWGEPVASNWAPGDRTTFFYNPFRNVWVYSIRAYGLPLGRTRYYAECKDLTEGLAEAEKLTHPWTNADRLDPHNPNPKFKDIPPQLYNLDATPYESLMLGLFSIWQGDPGSPGEKRNEVLIGFSRDGFHWDRPDRKPFAGVNETDGAWNWGNVQSAGGGCLVVGDKLFFYVSGRGKGRADEPATTGLAVIRRDGFASMDAGDEPGTLTTRPITFYGKCLFVNADARGGQLRVEVLDRDGKPYPALAKRLCMPMTTDSTIYPIQWMEPADLAAIAGKPVRFRFYLTHAKLYSFWVSQDASGASDGYVAAGGPGFTSSVDTVGQAAYKAAAEITSPADSAAGAPVGDWVCVTPHAAFTPRDTAENYVFDGRMWISNGWRGKLGHSDAVYTRDLWSSADGANWTLVSDDTPYDLYSEMVVFQNKVWAIRDSIWNSDDGVHWNKVLDHTPFGGRGYGEAVVLNGRIWQLGSGADVWSTPDGVNWTCHVKEAPYGDRSATAVAAFDDKLWLMAGRTDGVSTPPEKGYKQYTTHNDVWCSADGEQWTKVLDHAPWPQRMWSIATAYAGRLWLIGGYDNKNHRNLDDVWSTADGKNWERFESPTSFAPRHEVTPYVFKGSLWVATGNTWPVMNDMWRLTLQQPK